MAQNGCGNFAGDTPTNLADLIDAGYTPADDAGNALAVVNGAYRNPQAVLDAIRDDAGGVIDKDQARTNFLQAIHKEIAIQKITTHLATGPAVNPADLPTRTATALGSIPRTADNEYQTYAAFIRG